MTRNGNNCSKVDTIFSIFPIEFISFLDKVFNAIERKYENLDLTDPKNF